VKPLRVIVILLLLAVVGIARADAFYLKKGDRVVFLGDSITAQKLYTNYVSAFVRAFRPDLQCQFFNAGVSGDTTWGALKRLDTDVLANKPTLVTICFGMNDAGVQPTVSRERLTRYRDSLNELITRIQAAGARVVLLTTTAVDPTDKARLRGYNNSLAVFCAAVKDIGRQHKLMVIDLFYPVKQEIARYRRYYGDQSPVPDGVHPNEVGHMVMAMAILRAWGWPGTDKLVSPTH